MHEIKLRKLVVVENEERQSLLFETVDEKKTRLSMGIGPAEASELGRLLQDQETPRPLTHELMGKMLKALGGELKEVVIHDVRAGTFYAELVVDLPGREVKIDSRPSDALILSLRLGSPVFVTDD
ncbi:MAG: bifunctional nuclease family protein, partial [Planctomycetes bacterium]|nr:bifunctional nuclease family protein [Planctomycetota bacterium]